MNVQCETAGTAYHHDSGIRAGFARPSELGLNTTAEHRVVTWTDDQWLADRVCAWGEVRGSAIAGSGRGGDGRLCTFARVIRLFSSATVGCRLQIAVGTTCMCTTSATCWIMSIRSNTIQSIFGLQQMKWTELAVQQTSLKLT